MKKKFEELKSKLRYRAPEITTGLLAVVGVGSWLLYLKNTQAKGRDLQVNIPSDMADSILVLEQLTVDTFKDLDFGDVYRVTPID